MRAKYCKCKNTYTMTKCNERKCPTPDYWGQGLGSLTGGSTFNKTGLIEVEVGTIVNAELISGGRVVSQFQDNVIRMDQESTSGFGSGAIVMIKIENEVGASYEGIRTQSGSSAKGVNFSVGDTISVRSGISIEDTVIVVTEIDAPMTQKEVNADKFYGNDNEIDNHNATISVLNNIWVKMHRDFAKNNITASDNPSLEMITFSDKNLLDGWSINFTVEMPTSGVDLCIEC